RERLERLAVMFDVVDRQLEPWRWVPREQYLVYFSPLPPREAVALFERLQIPMERVWIGCPEEHERRRDA
ncbi:MAG: hypothetical protein N2C14_04905, partial [Planctomycetales bacterium]